MSLLELRDLEAGYGKLPILHKLSLNVNEGELVGVVGPNGAGKTTLCHTVCGLLPPMGGEIRFAGESVGGMEPSRLVRKGIGYVPQRGNVFPDMTVEENLELAAVFLGAPRGAVDEIYGRFPILRERRRQRAGTLSGGQRQMLAIGSALLARPRLLVLDEPTTGLAPRIVAELIEMVGQLKDSGCTILWVVEENPRQVLAHADRVYRMEGGVVTRASAARELIDDPNFSALFFGLA